VRSTCQGRARASPVGRTTTLVATIAVALAGIGLRPTSVSGSTVPDIVLILADDQQWQSLWAMRTVQSELVNPGIQFTNGFAVRPLCCPARANILTGQYPHSTNVYTSWAPHGGFSSFDDTSTIATWLDSAGYQTGFVGKYLGGYRAPYVPPGWDRFVAFHDKWAYYDYWLSVDGDLLRHNHTEADYSTDVFAAEAESFISGAAPGEPLFLVFAPLAVHRPATRARRHAGAFSKLAKHRPPNYDEVDVSDKPQWVRDLPRLTSTERSRIDQFRKDQFASLLALDEAVGDVVGALRDTGRLSNTMIVYSSDNGYSWGEHRWEGKAIPYEESIRVPFVIRYDPLIQSPRTDTHLVTHIDMAPTWAELAGVAAPDVEGQSLLPLIQSPEAPWRQDFLIEHYGTLMPSHCAVRTETHLYVVYASGEEELYDLVLDPYQLVNKATDPGHSLTVGQLRTRAQQLCEPPPPRFSFPYDALSPLVPLGLTPTAVVSDHVDLSWTASTDNVGVTGYTIYRDGSVLDTVDGATTTYSDLTVLPSTTYTYTVDAFDAAANHSAQSDPVTITTPEPPDVSPPTVPTDLTPTAVGSNQVDLSWTASTDNVGVTGYTIYRDGSVLDTVDGATTTYSDLTVLPSTTYTYTVDAFDAAANHSAQSDPVTVTTPEPESPRGWNSSYAYA
jgi:N-acetylglucosamine-6-sulfatase